MILKIDIMNFGLEIVIEHFEFHRLVLVYSPWFKSRTHQV